MHTAAGRALASLPPGKHLALLREGVEAAVAAGRRHHALPGGGLPKPAAAELVGALQAVPRRAGAYVGQVPAAVSHPAHAALAVLVGPTHQQAPAGRDGSGVAPTAADCCGRLAGRQPHLAERCSPQLHQWQAARSAAVASRGVQLAAGAQQHRVLLAACGCCGQAHGRGGRRVNRLQRCCHPGGGSGSRAGAWWACAGAQAQLPCTVAAPCPHRALVCHHQHVATRPAVACKAGA